MLPDSLAIDRLSDTFKALSDATRVKIVLALLKDELCVCEIAEIVGMSQSAVSHQLRKLKDMRLVKRRKSAKMVYYSLDDDHIIGLVSQCMSHVQEEFNEPIAASWLNISK
ncbi:MAG: metalloregulator ArsR/SmtB family transcription factor [Firmicutes bacterium]|nr:metalloregulator ArsR/SmtB family transcription factor [Bacillota bacterium]